MANEPAEDRSVRGNTIKPAKVGTRKDPVESVSTNDLLIDQAALQARQDEMIVPVAPGLSPNDAVNPSSTTDPVQTATDAVSSAGGGIVLLPGGVINEDTTYNPKSEVSLWGLGGRNQTVVEWPAGVDLVDFDNNQTTIRFQDLKLRGAGDDAAAADGIIFTTTANGIVFDNVTVAQLYGSAVSNPSGQPFECSFGRLFSVGAVDAGDSSALIDLQNAGPAWDAGILNIAPTTTTSGSDNTVLLLDTRGFSIPQLQIGGAPDRAIQTTANGSVSVGHIQYEPGSSTGTTDTVVAPGAGNITVDSIILGGSYDVDYVYTVFGGTEGGRFGQLTSGNANQNVVSIDNNPAGPVTYGGPLSKVTDNTGGLAEPNTVYAVDGPQL